MIDYDTEKMVEILERIETELKTLNKNTEGILNKPF